MARIGPGGQLITPVRTPRQPRIPRTSTHPSPPPRLRGPNPLALGPPIHLPGLKPPPQPKGTISVARYRRLTPARKAYMFGMQQSMQIDQQLAQRQHAIAQFHYQQRLQHYANRIALKGESSPQLRNQLLAEQRRNPHFQRDLNRVSSRTWNLAMAKSRSSPLALTELGIEGLANPVEWGAAGIRGVGELAHGHYGAGALDVAGVIPFLKPLRVGRAVGEGVEAGIRAEAEASRLERAAAATRASYRANQGVLRPLYGATRRATSPTLRAFERSPARAEIFDQIDRVYPRRIAQAKKR